MSTHSISRRRLLQGIGSGALLGTLPGCAGAAFSGGGGRRRRPNLLFIMSDDHACRAISCYGGGLNETPHLDRMAREGTRFDRAFCTNSICAPSRAVLLTGKHSHRNGVLDNRVAFDGSQVTFPKLMRQAGYETAMVGKWHLKSDPTGFDYWNILPGQGAYYNPDMIEMGVKKRITGYVTDIVTDAALAWLDGRKGDRPFCLLLHHKAPHRAWMPAPRHLHLYEDREIPLPPTYFDDYEGRGSAARQQEMEVARHTHPGYDLKLDPLGEGARGKWDRRAVANRLRRMTPEQRRRWEAAYGPRNRAFREAGLEGRELAAYKYQRYIKDYLRCIAAVDENVGRVLERLDGTGLAGETILVYTSDQGFYLGEHGWFDKRFIYEESLRLPLIVRCPGRVEAGAVREELVQNLDFAPTFLDYASTEIPAEMQGRSLRPLLRDRRPADWRRSIYYHYFEYPAVHMVKRHYGLRTPRYKLVHFYYDVDEWEMYDLEKDPHELNSVYDDPSYAQVRKGLETELRRLRRLYGDEDEKRFLPGAVVEVDHLARGCPVALKHPPSKKHTGGGPGALTDGRRAPGRDPAGGDREAWQGFVGRDLEATVDLGRVRTFDRVTTGFLQDITAWIFLPPHVDYLVSDEGREFRPLGRVENPLSPRSRKRRRQAFTLACPGTKARYLRVVAPSLGTCPPWHKGAGRPCWLFADEIILR